MFLVGEEQEVCEVEGQLIKGVWRNKQNDLGGYEHRARGHVQPPVCFHTACAMESLHVFKWLRKKNVL